MPLVHSKYSTPIKCPYCGEQKVKLYLIVDMAVLQCHHEGCLATGPMKKHPYDAIAPWRGDPPRSKWRKFWDWVYDR